MSFAFSFSVVDMYRSCAKKYYHLKVAKDFKDSDSSFSADGKAIHEALLTRVIDGTPLPLPMRYMEPIAAKFANTDGVKSGEIQLALNRQFEPCAWFDKDCYVRAIIDLLIIKGNKATIIDWKTGKVRPKPDQLKLAAAVLSQQMPEIEHFTCAFVWVNHKEVTPLTLRKENMADVWADWIEAADEMEDAIKITAFPASPSYLCRWCPVTSCPHNDARS